MVPIVLIAPMPLANRFILYLCTRGGYRSRVSASQCRIMDMTVGRLVAVVRVEGASAPSPRAREESPGNAEYHTP